MICLVNLMYTIREHNGRRHPGARGVCLSCAVPLKRAPLTGDDGHRDDAGKTGGRFGRWATVPGAGGSLGMLRGVIEGGCV